MIKPADHARFALLALAALSCVACSSSRGKPRADMQVQPPNRIVDFQVLFGRNCSGCHGANGRGGAAISLANPVFLAIADDSVIHRVVTNGVPGTSMPAFAESAGGTLTEVQVNILVSGIRSWAKLAALGNLTPPPYSVPSPGDPQRGAASYRTYCSSCHGADGRGSIKASSIVDSSYLALVSDQDLRTVVIAGRPELGAPDWRTDVEGKPMSQQDVSDVVAWLSGHRAEFPGQPYAISSTEQEKGSRP